MTVSVFLAIAAVHLLAAISPGPSFVVCIRMAISDGFRPALGLAAGFGLGAALWATAALAGLALLFEVVPVLYTTLKVAGGLFLLAIAVLMWRHAPDPLPDVDAQPTRTFGAAFRLGLLTFLSNPKPAVFFGAVFVGLVPTDASLASLIALVALIAFNETLWYVFVARVFSIPRARAAYARAKTWVDRALGTALGLLGARIALG